ncbi:chymotrypsinogen A-like [Pollicipes pollicipes]|uniref:chymotrypsinogen A-like n=1 Tax=Pollicipes pollicipes TaxID=41117 RepID=UPI001884EA84|nr:chymotrypsinogen A-like [Pollicipes pollicipes]
MQSTASVMLSSIHVSADVTRANTSGMLGTWIWEADAPAVQCAAVSTYRLLMTLSPQKVRVPPGRTRPACHGYSLTQSYYGEGTAEQAESASKAANRRSRVVGGTETDVNEYPWQAGLVRPGGTRTFCGGSVINSRYVLTAAHCTAGASASQIQVLLGDHRISVPDGETRYPVVQILQHPQFVSASTGYDFSLLRLDRTIVYDSRVAPVCLPQAGQTYAGVTAVATGFGRVGANMPQADMLLEVELPVLTQTRCTQIWGSLVRESMICAGGLPSGGKGVCNGDSGGPLVTSVSDRYTLIGLTSLGSPCANPNTPDVFARVTSALTWIEESTTDAVLCI